MTPGATIKRLVCEHWKVTQDALCGPRRIQSIARPRMIAMGLCRMLTDMSYPKIGMEFGGRDHSTAINATRRLREWIYAGDHRVVATILHVRRHFVADRADPCLRHLVPSIEPSRTDPFIDHCVDAGIRTDPTPQGDPNGLRRPERP